MDAVSAFLCQYNSFIKAKARRLARDAYEADELAQKANIVLWQKYDLLSPLRDVAIKAFLNKTLRNELIDLRRGERYKIDLSSIPNISTNE